MDFESVEQAASRLQVTTRTVQKWAKDGKIPGACQMGRAWMIPAGFAGPVKADQIPAQEESLSVQEALLVKGKNPTLYDAAFEAGHIWEYIERLPEGAIRDVAEAQLYHFQGQPSKAAVLAEPHLEHEDMQVALTASVVYCFSNLTLGRIHRYQSGMDYIKKHVSTGLRRTEDVSAHAYAVFCATMIHVVLHIPCPPIPPLDSVVRDLPEGVKLYAGYLMAYEAYLEKDHSRALGIAQMSLALQGERYPIPVIYLHLISCMALMNLRHTVEAKSQLEQAWGLARRDGLWSIFGEHVGLLQGLLEVVVKKKAPAEYDNMLRGARVFGESWRQIRSKETEPTAVNQLSAVEVAIAALFRNGWAVKEIAAYMDLSPRMVRHHISMIYEKLGITHREELSEYMVF